MAYKQRPGVVLIDVCGAKLLVAQRSVWEVCSGVQALGMLGHICWESLEMDIPRERLIRAISSLTRKSEAEAEAQLDGFYRKLFDQGFLIEVPDGENAHDEG